MLVSLSCASSETHNLQPVFLRIYGTKGGVNVPGIPSGDRGDWE